MAALTDHEQPGSFEAVIADYLRAVDAGSPPDRDQFLVDHPLHAAGLRSFFHDLDSMNRIGGDPNATLGPGESRTVAGGRIRYFGDYELLEEIARGGMGVVFKARQVSLNRLVALKMILSGQLASLSDVQRFYVEAEAAANLDHPNILPIYEVGVHDGQHYFSMKLVEGGSLAQHMGKKPPVNIRFLVETIARVARAVHFAHQRGILHRDLKPANVLLDQDRTPYVADFGLAKRTESDSTQTQSGAILGTPSYMAPEQARAEKQLTTAVDVYSVGAMLYEALTGRPPFRAATPVETIMQVLEKEPDHPRRLNPIVDVDLSVIALKCLEKYPAQRYGTAAELAAEMDRWLRGEPIQARQVGTAERVWRWCRRNPVVTSLTVAVAASLFAGIVVSSVLAVRASHQAERADLEAKDATEQARRANLEKELRCRYLYSANGQLAQIAWREADITRLEETLEAQRPIDGDEDLRGFEWHYLRRLCVSHRFKMTVAPGLDRVAVATDGNRIARIADDAFAEVCDLTTGQVLHRISVGPRLTCFALDASGSRFAAAAQDRIRLWDVATGGELWTKSAPRMGLRSLTFSADGRRVAAVEAGAYTGPVRVWDTASGQEIGGFKHGMGVYAGIAFSPNGEHVIGVAFHPSRIHAWHAVTGAEVFACAGAYQTKCRPQVSVDGAHIAVGCEDGSVRLWNGATGAERWVHKGHTKNVHAVSFSRDGLRLASAGDDGIAKVWDTASGREIAVQRGHSGAVTSLDFSPDGAWVVSGGVDRTVRVWESSSGQLLRVYRGQRGAMDRVGIDAKGQVIYSAGTFFLAWDATVDQESRVLRGASRGVTSVAFSPDGRQLACAGKDSSLTIWDTAAGAVGRTLKGLPESANDVVYAPNGQYIAAAAGGNKFQPHGAVMLWNPANGMRLRTLAGREAVFALAVSPDSRWLAGHTVPTVTIWNASDGKVARKLEGLAKNYNCLAFHPAGGRLATGVSDGTVRIWDYASGQELRCLRGRGDSTYRLAFSPTGDRLAASIGGELIIWDPDNGREVATIKNYSTWTGCLAFSPDGRRLAGGGDRVVRLWDVETGQEVLTLSAPGGIVNGVEFSPDGSLIAGGCTDGSVYIWNGTPLTEQGRPITGDAQPAHSR